jgi:hypothetical protein
VTPSRGGGGRFNWYKDGSDWKPFHHDSAAFNPRRAANQNITARAPLGARGATREALRDAGLLAACVSPAAHRPDGHTWIERDAAVLGGDGPDAA